MKGTVWSRFATTDSLRRKLSGGAESPRENIWHLKIVQEEKTCCCDQRRAQQNDHFCGITVNEQPRRAVGWQVGTVWTWHHSHKKFDQQIIHKKQFVSFSLESVHQVIKARRIIWLRLTFPVILDIEIALYYLTATWHTPAVPLLTLESSLDTEIPNRHRCTYATWVAQSLQNPKNRSSEKWETSRLSLSNRETITQSQAESRHILLIFADFY